MFLLARELHDLLTPNEQTYHELLVISLETICPHSSGRTKYLDPSFIPTI